MNALDPITLQLMRAANNGNCVEIAKALDEGADINARDLGGKTALMRVSETAKMDAIALLLLRNAEVNLLTPEGYTALAFAIGTAGNAAAVRLILQAGGKFDVKRIPWSTIGQPAFFKRSKTNDASIKDVLEEYAKRTRTSINMSKPISIDVDVIQAELFDKEAVLSRVHDLLRKASTFTECQSVFLAVRSFFELLIYDGLPEAMQSSNAQQTLRGLQAIQEQKSASILERAMTIAKKSTKEIAKLEDELSGCNDEVQNRLFEYLIANKEKFK